MKFNLGFQTPDYGAEVAKSSPVSDDRPTKTTYPTMTICDNENLARMLKSGQEVTAVVTFRVKEVAIRDRDKEESEGYDYPGSGTRVELSAREITFKDADLKPSTTEEDGAEAIQAFFGKGGQGFKSNNQSAIAGGGDGDGDGAM